jgi:ABC-type Fe3+/spermidine/putrescine transport system ATPase subunit
MTDLKVRNLKKSFGNFAAVRGVDFDVAQGEIVALLGASGCGKTTLLRMLSGLIKPDDGEINLGGRQMYSKRDNYSLAVEDRGIGFMFQSYAIWPHMKVWENVAYGLRVRKAPRAAARAKAEEMLEIVGLGGMGDRYPGTLSGGQQQRVALARCLVVEPPLLLLDEPLSNLDSQVRERMREYIRELIKGLGVSAVFVTHDYAEALVLADRILVMDAGQIAENATPEEIYARPRTRIAAESVGTSNLVHASGVDSSGMARIAESDAVLRLTEGASPGPVTLVIRPEDIRLDRSGSALVTPDAVGSDNLLKGTVVGRFYLGSTTHYEIETPVGRLRCQSSEPGIGISDVVDVWIPAEKVVALRA